MFYNLYAGYLSEVGTMKSGSLGLELDFSASRRSVRDSTSEERASNFLVWRKEPTSLRTLL